MTETEDTNELQRRKEHEASELRRKVKRELAQILQNIERQQRTYKTFTHDYHQLYWVSQMMRRLHSLGKETG